MNENPETTRSDSATPGQRIPLASGTMRPISAKLNPPSKGAATEPVLSIAPGNPRGQGGVQAAGVSGSGAMEGAIWVVPQDPAANGTPRDQGVAKAVAG